MPRGVKFSEVVGRSTWPNLEAILNVKDSTDSNK